MNAKAPLPKIDAMHNCKPWLTQVFRTPPPEDTRLGRWRLDKNEFLPNWHTDLFAEFQRRLTPEHISTHPELGRLYALLAVHTGLSTENLLVGAGSDLCIHAAFDAFVRPGSEVVIPAPTFMMYEIYARTAGASLRVVDYGNDLRLSADEFCRTITSATALVCLPNPGSPIGAALSPPEMRRIIAHAEVHGVPLLVDEAYYPFYPESVLPLVKEHPNLIVTRTLSKAAGLAGARVGFAAAEARTLAAMRAFKPMYEISFPSVLLAELVLENVNRMYEYAADVCAGRSRLNAFFQEAGYDTYPGEANFLLVNFGEARERITSALTAGDVLYKPEFSHPSLAGWSRFSVGPLAYTEKFIRVFEQLTSS